MDLKVYTESPGGCKKRKREIYLESNIKDFNGIANPAFLSSTPNKILIQESSRRSNQKSKHYNKENSAYDCIEVKSIAEIHAAKQNIKSREKANSENEGKIGNPYEVVRKPPKKKKKFEIEQACFENPALNLNAPERSLNPFEIKRAPANQFENSNDSCFINNGLDIRGQDSNVNPYEITRPISPSNNKRNDGIENAGLELRSPKTTIVPSNITLGIPFVPNINCRIDFQNVSLENFVSTETVVNNVSKIGNINALPVIKEDEEIDIGKELDCYQLELENSINEAKLKKTSIDTVKQKLKAIEESFDNEDPEDNIPIRNNNMSGIVPLVEENQNTGNTNNPKITDMNSEPCVKNNDLENSFKIEQLNISKACQFATPKIEYKKKLNYEDNIIEEENEIKDNGLNISQDSLQSDSDSEVPTPFIRCYRKPEISKKADELPVVLEITEGKDLPFKETKSKIGSSFRRSIRKLIHPGKKNEDKFTPLTKINEENINRSGNDDRHERQNHHQNIFQSIRQSLRRKPGAKLEQNKGDFKEKCKSVEISIIDCTERTKIFRSPNTCTNTKDVKIDKLKNIFTKHNKYNL